MQASWLRDVGLSGKGLGFYGSWSEVSDSGYKVFRDADKE